MAASGDAIPEICRFFQKGTCTFGDACLNRHLRAPCVFFAIGRCSRENCKFAHVTPPGAEDPSSPTASTNSDKGPKVCRFWASGTCKNGDDCGFFHSRTHPTEPSTPSYSSESPSPDASPSHFESLPVVPTVSSSNVEESNPHHSNVNESNLTPSDQDIPDNESHGTTEQAELGDAQDGERVTELGKHHQDLSEDQPDSQPSQTPHNVTEPHTVSHNRESDAETPSKTTNGPNLERFQTDRTTSDPVVEGSGSPSESDHLEPASAGPIISHDFHDDSSIAHNPEYPASQYPAESPPPQHWSHYADPSADPQVPFCKFHAQGQCSQGNLCRFRHSLTLHEFATLFHDTHPQLTTSSVPPNTNERPPPAQVSTFNICKFYPSGNCRNGDACLYLHVPFNQLFPNLTQSQDAEDQVQTEVNNGQWGQDDQYAENRLQMSSSGQPHDFQSPYHDHRPGQRVNRPCHRFREGTCSYGDKCKFLHSSSTPTILNWEQPDTHFSLSDAGLKQEDNGNSFDGGERDDGQQALADDGWNPNASGWQNDNWHISTQPNRPTDNGSDLNASTWSNHVDEWASSTGAEPTREEEYDPWAPIEKDPCPYFQNGRCKHGSRCNYSHDITPNRGTRRSTPRSATPIQTWTPVSERPQRRDETRQDETHSRSDGWPDAESHDKHNALSSPENELAGTVMTSASDPTLVQSVSSTGQGEKAVDLTLPDNDEKTWDMEWSQPEMASLPPAKVQAPCLAFGQGHCPHGDDCRYLHIVFEEPLADRGQVTPPAQDFQHGETEINVIAEGTDASGTVNESPALLTPDEQGELLVERTLFNCKIHFGLDNGCFPTNIIGVSDTCSVVVSNLPPDLSSADASKLIKMVDEENDCQDMRTQLHLTKTSVFARFSAPKQAENAVSTLHGQMYDGRKLVAWRTHETVQTPLESRTVMIKWPAPSRSVWFYYPTITSAKEHEKKLNGITVDGRKIKAEFSRPRPTDQSFAVKVSGFHIGTDDKEIKKIAQGTKLTHKNAPTYIENPLDNIRDTLAAQASLECFYRLPLDPRNAKHTAFARFDDADLDTLLAVHGRPQSYIADGSLSLQRVFHANYKLSERRYRAVAGQLEQLIQSAATHQCTLNICLGTEPPVDIHLYADASVTPVPSFGQMNQDLYKVLQGEIMMTEDGDDPVPIWDEYFEMASSTRKIDKINQDTSFFIKVDARRRIVRVLGEETSRAKARSDVLKLLNMVEKQRRVLPLDLPGIRALVDGAYAELQVELGGPHKVILDLAIPELVIWGDADFKKASESLVPKSSTYDSLPTAVTMTPRCFVCKRRPEKIVELSCKHVYCAVCLQYVLLLSAGAHFTPPRCLAGCEEYIPYNVVRDVLPTTAEAALLRNAFLMYVRAREDQFFFCPIMPNCETVFRRPGEGRVGPIWYCCESCQAKICAWCGEEYHEGTVCSFGIFMETEVQ
ncbi:hypothetical protein H0H93_010966 [Arthromyces matolae]|nr:hypothetical protein H0H93_010966 [Arthromyces matolae]